MVPCRWGIFALAGAAIGAIRYGMSAKGVVKGTQHLTTISKGQQFNKFGRLTRKYITDIVTPASKLALPAENRRFFGEISERGMQATLNLYSKTAFNAVQAAIPGTIRNLMIKSIAPVIILPIVNLITSIGVGHVYNRLGWC